MILSGDDHDYCNYTHVFNGKSAVEENTIPTFSFLMGNIYPGYAILEFPDSTNTATTAALLHQQHPKLHLYPLIPQLRVYYFYLFLLGITCIACLILPSKRRQQHFYYSLYRRNSSPTQSIPRFINEEESLMRLRILYYSQRFIFRLGYIFLCAFSTYIILLFLEPFLP